MKAHGSTVVRPDSSHVDERDCNHGVKMLQLRLEHMLFQNVAFSLIEKSGEFPQMTGGVKRIVFSDATEAHIAVITFDDNYSQSWDWNRKESESVTGEVTARAYDEDDWNYASLSFSVAVDGDKATLDDGRNSD
jgi:hypothetical protein